MLKRYLLLGAALGLVVPACLWAHILLTGEAFGLFEVVLWPPSILLMATESAAGPSAWLVLVLAVVLNALWYALIASIVCAVVSLIARALPQQTAEP